VVVDILERTQGETQILPISLTKVFAKENNRFVPNNLDKCMFCKNLVDLFSKYVESKVINALFIIDTPYNNIHNPPHNSIYLKKFEGFQKEDFFCWVLWKRCLSMNTHHTHYQDYLIDLTKKW
jgi:hypothetical protein